MHDVILMLSSSPCLEADCDTLDAIIGDNVKKEDIEKVVEVRSALIKAYRSLDGGQSASTAVIKQDNVAALCEQLISKLDNILAPYVNFD